jgi:hypothetical protein
MSNWVDTFPVSDADADADAEELNISLHSAFTASPDSDQVMRTSVANIPNATKIAPSRRHV